MRPKAVVAMSGGVDSSVAAWLTCEQGFDCIGVTMKLFDNEAAGVPREKGCCSLEDAEDARAVAYRLGMPFYVFDFSADFARDVIDPFALAYRTGRTPNPCIDCNRKLKFDRLYHRARELERDVVVTGHYARITRDTETGRWLLKKAVDADKDQSYVLYTMTQDQLAHTRFPLGELTKPEVRRLAEEQGFRNAHKRESQDICFVREGTYADFLEHYTGRTYPPGDFVDRQGRVLGRHRGIIRYTVGQRKGLGLALPEPLYVCAVDPAANTVTLGREDDLFSTVLTAAQINLIAQPSVPDPTRLTARIRYRQSEQPCTVLQLDDDRLQVTFDRPQRAITPGQAVVLYDGDTVFGGGVIE